MQSNLKPNYSKALKSEKRGDKLVSKGKYREAIQAYQDSEQHFSEREEIYQKLIDTLNKVEEPWSEEEFSASVTWTMRQQELQNPKIKRVHEQFSLEFQEVLKLAQQLMIASSKEMEEDLTEKILAYEEKASLPLIHFILSFKDFALQGISEENISPPKSFDETPKVSQDKSEKHEPEES